MKEITIKDIANIIRKDIDNKDKTSNYGFKLQNDILLFGKYNNGLMSDPYLFYSDNEDISSQLYDMFQNEFPDMFYYGYSHFAGEYYYFGVSYNHSIIIQFPSFNLKDQEWIHNQFFNNFKEKTLTK